MFAVHKLYGVGKGIDYRHRAAWTGAFSEELNHPGLADAEGNGR